MAVDPVSMFVAALVVAALVKRVPDLVAQFTEQAKEGESDEDRRRAERLAKAGLEPASGGPARRFFVNLWRDAWLDLDDARQARRDAGRYDANGEPGRRSWWDRARDWWRDRREEEARRRTDRWRSDDDDDDRWNHPDDDVPDNHEPDNEGPDGRNNNADDDPPSGREESDEPWSRRDDGGGPDKWDHQPDPWSSGDQNPGPDPWADADPRRHQDREKRDREQSNRRSDEPDPEPVGGTLDRTDPPPTPQPALAPVDPTVIEGEVVTEVARGGAVTGVVSGAAEARAIQRAMDETNAAYIAALERLRRRIIALGEQTLSEVQMSARSDVVQHTAQAAEAAASAQAHARGVGAEVGPLLGLVARAFNRRNS